MNKISEEITLKESQKLKEQVSKLDNKLNDQLKKSEQKMNDQIINLEKKDIGFERYQANCPANKVARRLTKPRFWIIFLTAFFLMVFLLRLRVA